MKLDEFAFFNQQLAAMLRDASRSRARYGLARKCAPVRWRTELQSLEPTRRGTPMADALNRASCPNFTNA